MPVFLRKWCAQDSVNSGMENHNEKDYALVCVINSYTQKLIYYKWSMLGIAQETPIIYVHSLCLFS